MNKSNQNEFNTFYHACYFFPREDAEGFKSRIRPPYPQRVAKGDYMEVCRNHRIKRVVPCRCRAGTLKNHAKCLWRWEPGRRYNIFSPPAHLCRHI